MADPPSNEFLQTKRAQEDDKDLFAAIGKQVLNLELKDGEEPSEDERVKVVEEIESLCMSCEDNVRDLFHSFDMTNTSPGHDSFAVDQDPFLS